MKRGRARSVFIGVCVTPAVILFIIFMLIPTINVFKKIGRASCRERV